MPKLKQKETIWEKSVNFLSLEKLNAVRERFVSKQVIHPDSSCWYWTGCKSKDGFGLFWLQGRNTLAHRVAWFLQYKKLPETNLLHTCGNPACVNPKHLFQVSPKQKYDFYKKQGRQGIFPSKSKLTKQDFFDIQDLYENSALTVKEIGEIWGISPQYVSRIGRRANVK